MGSKPSGMRRLLTDLRELKRACTDLFSEDPTEEQAGYELAVSARRFSHRAREVVNDKLSFSATLMRAGEVEAATRLLAEVEQDVRNEEASLLEQVAEARAAAAVRRERVTRLRIARTLATAMLGACLFASSAIGMAVASWFKDATTDTEPLGPVAGAAVIPALHHEHEIAGLRLKPAIRELRIGGIRVRLNERDLRRLEELTSGTVDSAQLQSFLMSVLPADIAQKVHAALVTTTATVSNAVTEVAGIVEQAAPKPGRKKGKGGAPKGDSKPQDEPEPSPSNGNDGGSQGGSSGGDGEEEDSSGGGGDDEGEGPLPVLLR